MDLLCNLSGRAPHFGLLTDEGRRAGWLVEVRTATLPDPQLLGGAILLLGAAVQSYSGMVWVMLVYCLLYAPTLALTNSIAFMNLKNSEKEFGRIRVWGTIGWIAAGWALFGWRLLAESAPALALKGDVLLLAACLIVLFHRR